ncbi:MULTISPECIES: VENN motif pre-toxin domain-containing protein [unclassified Tatumella]|uniref:VENN motif pre-toxin domain-containing protein n=1 Tax=unclassified Tatumella TaxID=2649542 RepID=UPI0032C47B5C
MEKSASGDIIPAIRIRPQGLFLTDRLYRGNYCSSPDSTSGLVNPILDREKQQKRLQQAQLIGEIGSQAADIARTQGQTEATKAGKTELAAKGVKEPGANATKEDIAAYNKTLTESSGDKTAQQKWGTGSAIRQGMQAATAAVQGLAGGNLAQVLAGGLSPYAAGVIREMTTNADGSTSVAANAMAHAVLGAVAAKVSDNSALAGAAGAASGELMARYIAETLYPGVKPENLTEEQKQTLSVLGTLAAGLAGGLAGEGTGDAVVGAQSGKNAVENNALSAGSDLGFWLGNTPGCDTACKTGIAKGVAEGNLVVSAGVAGVAGGAMIVGATPEIVAAAKAALEGCKAAPAICLNNAGLQVAEGVTPGGVGAAGAIGVGKTAAEAAAKAEAVVANTAKNAGNGSIINSIKNTAETQVSVDQKLANYLLDKQHPVGGSKAEWFDSALGFNKTNSNELAKQIVFDSGKAVKTAETQFGTKYDQVIPITGTNGRTINVKFGWIENNDGVVRLVTAIPAKK